MSKGNCDIRAYAPDSVHQIGKISFHAVMATAWPWPYPESYSQEPNYLSQLTVPMNRADTFFERDATGWQFIDVRTGNIDLHYQLPNNINRSVVFNEKASVPQDVRYGKGRSAYRPWSIINQYSVKGGLSCPRTYGAFPLLLANIDAFIRL